MKLIVLALCILSYLNVVTASTRMVNVTELMKILDKIHPTILQHDLRSYPHRPWSYSPDDNMPFPLQAKLPEHNDKPAYGNIVHLSTGPFHHKKEKEKPKEKEKLWLEKQDFYLPLKFDSKLPQHDNKPVYGDVMENFGITSFHHKKEEEKPKEMKKLWLEKPELLLPLKSASKLSQNDDKPVYGNLENLGITYLNTTAQLLYTGFRRGNYIWTAIINNKTKKKGKNKSSTVIVIQPKLKPNKHTLRDKILKYLDYLKTMDDSVQFKNALKPQNMIENKLEKKIQDLLDSKGQIEFTKVNKNEKLDKNTNVNVPIFKTNDEALNERSKRIQDFLNNHMPVFNTKPRIEDTSTERKALVEDYLNYHTPGGREKLSLDEKTKQIQDFLNKKSPIFIDANSLKDSKGYFGGSSPGQNLLQTGEDENNANEIVDPYSTESSEETDGVWHPDYRRTYKKKKKHRNRDSKYEAKESESEESASSDYDKNPGNPFTVHKNKYKKNWLWNHFMDGDHMNINPFGPLFANMGPSGTDLFFGRKWWYYNQDDYKPLG